MKHKRIILFILLSAVLFLTCETDPLTGESNFYLFSDSELFAMAFEQYAEFLEENKSKVLPANDPKTENVRKIGDNIRKAAEKWYTTIPGASLNGYAWEYNVIEEKTINAWCMPGGKIVVYTGILPVTENDDALATVMGHEVAHALLNHGKQRLSWGYLQQIGGALLLWALGGTSEDTQNLFLIAYGLSTNLGFMLPFSRGNESQADEYGLYLMAIAGYTPEESTGFWERMAKQGSSGPEFLSTHPSHETRISDLKNLIPIAKAKADQIGIINK
jgi:predicted Zn-dependent protease